MRRTSLLVIAGALVLGMGSATAGTTNQDYVAAGLGDVVNECADENPTGMNVGAACVDIGGNKSLTIKVRDDVSPRVAFYWAAYDANGDCAETEPPLVPGDEPGCASDGFACHNFTITTPPKTARFKIMFDGPVFAAASNAVGTCGSEVAGPGVVGTVQFIT